jgi:protein-L-isoaspartate(D-aspartate) O-methyltransferase
MTEPIDEMVWRKRATVLAGQLVDAGVLTDSRWQAAFTQTPRHVFVPRFYRDDHTIVDGTDPAETEEWLDGVYSDDSLVVQRAKVVGAGQPWPTSSSTLPSLMARMLELLEVTDGSRVLEIGTATGYNAALLCHRLGADQVSSIELHAGLAADAAEHLHMLGYYPSLAVGDGAAGVPTGAPYDRILATCAVPAIPSAWIDQLAPGGRIVTDLRGEMSSSLAVLDKTAPGVVRGRLLEQPGHFMWLRPDPDNPLLDADRFNFVVNHDEAETSTTDLDPGILDEPGLRVLLGILEPTLSTPSVTQRNGTTRWMHADGGSWVEITGRTVIQGGPRRIWPAIEHAVAEWHRLGTPGRGHYRLTATAEGDHHYSVDTVGEHRLIVSARRVR